MQRGLTRNRLVASGRNRGRGALGGSCGQKSLGTRQRESVSIVVRLNAAKHMLIADRSEIESCFAERGFCGLREKQNDIGTILPTGEKQDSGLLIAKPRDSVFARRMCLASGYELERNFHDEPVDRLGLRRNGEAGKAN